METLTKKIVVNGREMVMSSMDGSAWFLKPESMLDFVKRLQNIETMEATEFEHLEEEPVEESLANAFV